MSPTIARTVRRQAQPRVDATTVTDPVANPGVGTVTDSFEVVAVQPPAVKTIGPIVASTRGTPLSEPVALEFVQAIDPATLTLADLSLTRDGGPNLLTGTSGAKIRPISNTKFQIGGLAGLTSSAGRYLLTVDTRGIKNDFGDPGTTTTPTSPLVDLKALVLTSIPAHRTVTVLPTSGGAVVSIPPSIAVYDFATSPNVAFTPASSLFPPLGLNTITAKATTEDPGCADSALTPIGDRPGLIELRG